MILGRGSDRNLCIPCDGSSEIWIQVLGRVSMSLFPFEGSLEIWMVILARVSVDFFPCEGSLEMNRDFR